MFWLGLGIGIIVGECFTIFIFALLSANDEGDKK